MYTYPTVCHFLLSMSLDTHRFLFFLKIHDETRNGYVNDFLFYLDVVEDHGYHYAADFVSSKQLSCKFTVNTQSSRNIVCFIGLFPKYGGAQNIQDRQ